MRRTLFNRGLARIMRLSLLAEQQKLPFNEALSRFDDAMEALAKAKWSRREMIRTSAAGLAAMGLPLAACKTTLGTQNSLASKGGYSSQGGDVVIIGGGLAGLTCAYRLLQAGVASTIYEASSRLGGRVFSARNFNADQLFCELGAELVDSTNHELIELAQELGLTTEGYAENDPMTGEDQIFFYDGKVYGNKELFAALRPFLASVKRDIDRIFPDGKVFWPSYSSKNSDLLIKYDHMSLAEYFSSKASLTSPWVIDALRGAYETEYGGALARQSALNFLCLADTSVDDGFTWYGASDEWGRVQGGNQGLIDKLSERLGNHVPIEMEHELVAIAAQGEQLMLTFSNAEHSKTVKAASVVCALPFSVLRKVDGIQSLGLSALKTRSIKEFAYGTNAKFMSSYKARIWRHGNGKLPPSQAAVMTDLTGGMYWETSRIQPGKSGIITNFLGGEQGARVTEAHLGSILQDVDTLWSGMRSLHDGNAKLMAWTREKFTMGSYSSPAPGQYTTFIGIEGKSELDDKLHFIGEHASGDWIGFMNGAIQTGNQTAYKLSGKTLSKVTQEGASLGLVDGTAPRRRKWRRMIT